MSSPTRNSDRLPAGTSWLAGILGVVLMGGAAFAISEVAVRVAVFPEWRALSVSPFVRHPAYGHITLPNAAIRQISPPDWDVVNHTNHRGFRDREVGFEDDLRSLWIAGDSNTYGRGLEDSALFSTRLQALGYANANLAVEGHGAGAQAKVMQSLAEEGFRPRAVILILTLNNAIRDQSDQDVDFSAMPAWSGPNLRGPAKELPSALFVARLRDINPFRNLSLESFKTRLIRNSALYCWLKVEINRIPAVRALALRMGLKADIDFTRTEPLSLLIEPPDGEAQTLIRSTGGFIQEVGSWVGRTLGAKFGVVLLPSHHHLYPARFDRFIKHFGYEALRLDPRQPLRMLKIDLEARGVAVLDPTPAFEAAQDPQLTFLDDAHYNAKAHRILAETIAAWLERTFAISAAP